MERISTSPRYLIDITGPVPVSGGFGGGGDFQHFGEFGASGCARTMKIGRRVSDRHKFTFN